MLTGRSVMTNAAVLLNDEEHIRWPLPELAGWINEATRAIVLAKPSASSDSRAMQLAQGTLQRVPDTGTPTPLGLVRIVRNLKSITTPREGGRIITTVDRASLDAEQPLWHDRRQVPYRREVRHAIYDEAVPLEFYVFPGNDGTGVIEIVVSTLPTPLVASGAVDDIASYGAELGLDEPYSVPILDYVLFRSLNKDDIAGNAGRAMAHYQAFAAAIGLKIQVERATSPNARA